MNFKKKSPAPVCTRNEAYRNNSKPSYSFNVIVPQRHQLFNRGVRR